jgi:hypothetical protein
LSSGCNLPNWTKLECDIPCVVLFHNCVLWPCPTSKMSAISSGWLKTWKSLKIENFGTTIKDQTKLGPNSPYLVPFQTKLGFCLLSKTSIIKYRLKTRYAFKFLSPFCWIKALICWRYYWVWGLSDNKTIYNTEY